MNAFPSAAPMSLSVAEATRLYGDYAAQKAKKAWAVQDDLKRDLESGFLVPYLLDVETMMWGRWDYWTRVQVGGALPDAPIPRIDFIGLDRSRGNHGQKMLLRCIDAVGGSGWSLSRSIETVLDFALFGFGYLKELPEEPRPGAWMRLYQLFDLWPLLIWPYDYLGDIMAEAGIGKGADFYPTPHELCEMMTLMNYGEGDHRATTVCDPCVGTGRMLLHASNHSLRLFAQDISHLAVRTTIFNGYLYAPWLVKGIEFDEAGNVVQSERGRMWNMVLRFDALMRGVNIGERAAPESAAVPIIEIGESTLERLFEEADFVVERAPNRAPSFRRRAKTEAPAATQLNLLEI